MALFRYFIVILFFSTLSWGCALCKLQVPDVNVSVAESHTDASITLDIRWQFQKYFSAETLLSYDENRNEMLDIDEITAIHSSFTEYLKNTSYLTYIKYVQDVDAYEESDYLVFEVTKSKTDFIDDQLIFTYTLTLQTAPREGDALYISLFDEQRYFNFTVSKVVLQDKRLMKSLLTSEYSASFVPYGDPTRVSVDESTGVIDISGDMVYEEETKPEGMLGMLTEAMEKIKERVLDLVEDIVVNESVSSYIWLLFFSFVYGIIHALGPGHGKSLVAAYFLGNNRSTVKAFSIASLIGVVHTFSAFILTFTLYYILNSYLSEYFDDLEYVTIKISAMVIILIALYLLYKKLPKKQKTAPLWSTQNPNEHESSCGCGACKSTSTDLGIILSAGIVPCPGTITIFVFALSFGAYMVGFLSAVFMSLGMSLVIFVAALLSIKVRQSTSSNQTLRSVLDYGSLLFILSLGLILLLV
jgi:nickel/cobalt exporter